MKHAQIKFSTIVLSMFLTLALPFSSYSQRARFGGDSAGGGDAVKLEFTSLAQTLVDVLPKISANEAADIPLSRLVETIRTTKIETADTVELNGVEVDAVNEVNPPKITLSRKRWLALGTDLDRKLMFVLHEYLGALRLPFLQDSHYKITGMLYRQVKGLLPQDFGKSHRFSCVVSRTNEVDQSHPIAYLDDVRGQNIINLGDDFKGWGLVLWHFADNYRDDKLSHLTVLFGRLSRTAGWAGAEIIVDQERLIGDTLISSAPGSKIQVEGGRSRLRLFEGREPVDLVCYKTLR
jgi:hypothetical protein